MEFNVNSPILFLLAGIVIAVVASLVLTKTRLGLHLRAVGENPATADAMGINVSRYKYAASCIGSAIAGLGGFYYIIDYKGWRKYTGWLKVYGMNSILAYMLAMCMNFSCIGHSLFHGLEQYIGDFYPILITMSNVSIVYFILWYLYKKQIFLRV